MWKRIKKSKTPENVENFRKFKQKIKNRLRAERTNYVKNISDKIHRNSKRFWSYISFKSKKKPVPEKVTYNNAVFSDDQRRAEAFNDFFKSIYKDHSACGVNVDVPLLPGVKNFLAHVIVSVDEIEDLLRSLDTHKAIGHNKLPTIVLKECAESLAPSIIAIINFSLSHGFQLSDIKLKLIPLSYWLEYLDLVFFFKCPLGLIDFTREFSHYFSFLKGNARRASSGLHLKLNACRTSSFRDFYFHRITLMWNSLPKNIKDSDTISSFKSKLKSFYFTRLLNAFDGDNFHSFKLICPKCRRVNTSSVCTC